ncbi:NADPH:quinone reductase-like Zn-dependent oxidoreductase [Actinopolyspora lacussalsi]|nr:NADPH:quinone reductase-like Zn-dependent oxidoreductase [Actinopolyspora lacussalsi]
MRAVRIEETGDPEVVGIERVEDPAVGAGDVLIEVVAAGVNPIDVATRNGTVPTDLPAVLGWDVSGTVRDAGEDVTRFGVGDPVIAMSAQAATGRGTHAEYVALPESLLAPAPRELDQVEAAALPLAGLTASQTVTELGSPSNGAEELLVVGAQGAVGSLVVQLARLNGWRISTFVRPSDVTRKPPRGVLRQYSEEHPPPPAGFSAVVDTAGVPEHLRSVCDEGRYLTTTPFAQPEPSRGVRIVLIGVEQDGDELARLGTLVDEGSIEPGKPSAVVDFERADWAHRTLENGGTRGKLILVP